MESKWFVENSAASPAVASPPKPMAEKATTPARRASRSETVRDEPKPRYGLVGTACGVGGLLVGFVVGLVVAFGLAGERKQSGVEVAHNPVPAGAVETPIAVPVVRRQSEELAVPEPLPPAKEESPGVVQAEPPAKDKPLVAPVPQEPLPPGELPKPARATTDTYGTAVEFMINPLEAIELAGKEKKLMFVMHISGNFEEAKFT